MKREGASQGDYQSAAVLELPLFYDDYVFDVTSVYDDKPFYFNFFSWRKFPQLYRMIGNQWQPFLDSGFLLIILFLQSLLLSAIFIFLPVAYFKKAKSNKKPLVYFFCIGIAYLSVEIVLIQKFILFLGHAVYASAIIIFSMLLFSGIGSLLSEKYSVKKLVMVVPTILVFIIIYNWFIPIVIKSFIATTVPTKMLVALLSIAPLAVLMGFPFPLGLKSVEKPLVPWAFAVNGSASVLSPIIAVLAALSFGYSTVLIASGLVYLAGILFIPLALFRS